MITAVIFDMDGVIADSEYFNVKAKHLILKRAGIEVDWHYHDKFLGTTHEYMWAEMKKEYLKQHRKVMYYNLMTKGQLTQYLADEEQRALKLEDKLMKEMSATQGLTEELKAKDMMKWVQLTNNLRNEVREIVTQQIIMSV